MSGCLVLSGFLGVAWFGRPRQGPVEFYSRTPISLYSDLVLSGALRLWRRLAGTLIGDEEDIHKPALLLVSWVCLALTPPGLLAPR